MIKIHGRAILGSVDASYIVKRTKRRTGVYDAYEEGKHSGHLRSHNLISSSLFGVVDCLCIIMD